MNSAVNILYKLSKSSLNSSQISATLKKLVSFDSNINIWLCIKESCNVILGYTFF